MTGIRGEIHLMNIHHCFIYIIYRFLFSESNQLLHSLVISLERMLREDKALGKEYAQVIIHNLTTLSDELEYSWIAENVSNEVKSLLVDVMKEKTYKSFSPKGPTVRKNMNISQPTEDNMASVDLLASLSWTIKEKGELGLESLKLLSEVVRNDNNCTLFTEYYLDLLPPIVSILKCIQHNSSELAFTYCLSILKKLSTVEDSRILISNPSLEVMDTLCSIILNNTNGARIEALDIIKQTYIADQSSPMIRSPPIGLLRALVNLISQDHENRLKALEIICNMSVSTNYRKVLAMSSIGLFEELVNIIRTDEGRLRLEAFVIIGNLLSYQENIKKLSSPQLGLIEVLKEWKLRCDGNISNEEEVLSSRDQVDPLVLCVDQMIESLELKSYNSDIPFLAQQLSPSFTNRINLSHQ